VIVVDAMQVITAVCALLVGAGAVLLVVARLAASRVPLAARVGGAAVAARNTLTLVVAGGSMLGTRPRVAIHHTSRPARSWAAAPLVTRSATSAPGSSRSATVPGTTLRPNTIWPLTSSQIRPTMAMAEKRMPALPDAVTGRRTR